MKPSGPQDNQRRPWHKRLNRLNVGMSLALFVIVALTATVFWVRATSVSDRKDQMSNQVKSLAAAHQLNFKLAPGNSFDAGESVAVDFPADFVQAGTWTTADFTLTDGTARPVTAVNVGPGASTVACADGANDIGVAFDTTTLVFRAIPCGPSFASSAAGASITFVIDGETPNGTLTNPATAGSYQIDILNAAGDCTNPVTDICSLAVAVVDTAQVNITAMIPSTCGNSIIEPGEECDPPGSGPPACNAICRYVSGGGTQQDTTPPIITAVACSGVTKTGMNITWTTDEAANSLVRYGLTSGYGLTGSDPGYLMSHNVPLSGLSEGTLYHYQVCSTDASNNQNCSTDNTCATADETPPVITGVTCTPGATSLQIDWTTDENSTSYVDYALTAGPPYGSTTGTASPLITAHSVTLSGLTQSATYHYRVRSMDAFGNERLTVDATCVTSGPVDITPPVISNVSVTQLTPTSAQVTWDTDENATTDIDWGTADGPPYPNTYGDPSLIISHSAIMNGLTAGTLYHIRLRATDAVALTAVPVKTTFTFGDVTPPVITNLRAINISSSGATVVWDTNEPADSKTECGTTTAYGSTRTDSALVLTPHSLSQTGLQPETLYYCRVTSADIANNSTSQTFTFTTVAGAPACTVDCDNMRLALYIINPDGTQRRVGSIYSRVTQVSPGIIRYAFEDRGDDMDLNDVVIDVDKRNCGGVITTATVDAAWHHQVKTEIYYNEVYKKDLTLWADSQTAAANPRTLDLSGDQDICQGPPIITDIRVTSLSTTSVAVTWRTDKPSDSAVLYGLTAGPPYTLIRTDAASTLVHSVTLPNLTPGTLYHFRVRSVDSDGRSAAGPDVTFTAGDVTAPAITDVRVFFPTTTSATITWNTNEPADSLADYGLTPSYGLDKANSALATAHTLTLTGLAADTTYYYLLTSTDALGNAATSADLLKTPKAAPPCVVEDTDLLRIDLHIVNPDGSERYTGTPFARVTQLSPTANRFSFEDKGDDMDMNDVVFDVDYTDPSAVSFTIFSLDAAWHHQVHAHIYYKDLFKKHILVWQDDFAGLGNPLVLDLSNDQQVCYEQPQPPAITDIRLKSLSPTSVAVSWNTDEPATSYVDYGLAAGPPYPSGPGNDALVDAHVINLTGLVPGTLYHFRVRSADADDNMAASPDDTFTAGDVTGPDMEVPPAAQSGSPTETTITWTTDEPSTTVFEYGTTTDYGTTITDPDFATDHTVSLTDLEPGTTYYYQITSTDEMGNVTVETFSFTTPTGVPPEISDIRVNNLSTTSVRVSWTTNKAATSFVDYGLAAGPPYALTQGAATPAVTDHSVSLTGLTTGSLYHFRVRSAADGSEATSLDRTFTAGDYTPPDITAPPAVEEPTPTGATITWTTDEPSDSLVEYGTTPSYGETIYDPEMVTDHSAVLTDLTPGTTYYVQVTSVDANGNVVVQTFTFTTPLTLIPVGNVTNFRAVGGDRQVVLTWTNPTETSFAGVKILARNDGYPSGPADGRVVYDGTAQTVTDSGLTGGINYYYAAFAHDAVPNHASGALASAKTSGAPDTMPPGNVTDAVATGRETDIVLTWKNPIDADFRGVLIIRRPDQYPTGPYDGRVVYDSTGLSGNRLGLTGSGSAGGASADAVIPGASAAPSRRFGLINVAQAATVRLAQSTPTDLFHGRELFDGITETLTDPNVTVGVTYYYAIYAHDDVPNYASGILINAKTTGVPDTRPLPEVTDFIATGGDRRIELTWVNPIEPDLESVLIRRDSPTCPSTPTDGVMVYNGLGTSLTDVGLTNGQPYCYRAFAFDGRPNYSPGVRASATPELVVDLTAPGQVTGLVAIPGDAKVRLNWINPSDADWVATRIVRKAGEDPTGPTDGLIVFEGLSDTVLDAFSVVNGTTYHYAAYAFDTRPNYAPPALTTAKPEAGLPEPPLPGCTDSDGGRNYNVRGEVTDIAGNYTDMCADTLTVRENFCDGGRNRVENAACGSGNMCYGGTCVSEDFEPDQSICGDSQCVGNEDATNCLADCSVKPLLPEVVPENRIVDSSAEWPDGIIPESRLQFRAANGKVRLRLGPGNVLNVLPAMSLTVVVPDESLLARPTKDVYVNFLGSSHMMRPQHSLDTDIQTPDTVGTVPLQVVLNYVDGTSEEYNIGLTMLAHGNVYELNDDNQRLNLENVRVSLFVETSPGNFGLWDGETYGQLNPRFTTAAGSYAFIVEPGVYRLRAEKEGYTTKETLSLPIGNENVITRDLLLIKPPEVPFLVEVRDIVASAQSVGDKIGDLYATTNEHAGYAVDVAVENATEFVQNPFVEQATERAAAPVAAVIAVANVASYGAATATGFPYLMHLYSLISHPFMLIARRRRRKWGVVFNALTRMPVDLAIVRLTDGKSGRVLRTAVTDKDGRYVFIVQPGDYKLSVAKSGFVFPTTYLTGQSEAVTYVDLYHGENLIINKETSLTLNIPIDPLVKEKTSNQVIAAGIGRRFQASLGVLAILAMGFAAFITPTPFVFGMLFVNIIAFFVFRRLSVTAKPKSWGIVYDEKTRKPLANALARIFEARFNKLLETQITDNKGRYTFLVGRNVYYVTFEKPGYQKQQKGPVDLVDEKKAKQGVIGLDVGLPPVDKGAAPDAKTGGGQPSAPVAPKAPAGAMMTGGFEGGLAQAKPVSPAPTAAPSLPPALSASGPAVSAAAPAAPSKPVSWEMQLLQKTAAAKPAPSRVEGVAAAPAAQPAAPPQTVSPTPARPPEQKPAPVWGGFVQPKTPLIQDFEHAHPEGEKGIKTSAPIEPGVPAGGSNGGSGAVGSKPPGGSTGNSPEKLPPSAASRDLSQQPKLDEPVIKVMPQVVPPPVKPVQPVAPPPFAVPPARPAGPRPTPSPATPPRSSGLIQDASAAHPEIKQIMDLGAAHPEGGQKDEKSEPDKGGS